MYLLGAEPSLIDGIRTPTEAVILKAKLDSLEAGGAVVQ